VVRFGALDLTTFVVLGAVAAKIATIAVATTGCDSFLQLDDAEAAWLRLLLFCPWDLVLLLFLAWFHGGTSLQEMG
jgi:hypothetical protein